MLTGKTITDDQVRALLGDVDPVVADYASIALTGVGRDGAFGSEDRANCYCKLAEILNARAARTEGK